MIVEEIAFEFAQRMRQLFQVGGPTLQSVSDGDVLRSIFELVTEEEQRAYHELTLELAVALEFQTKRDEIQEAMQLTSAHVSRLQSSLGRAEEVRRLIHETLYEELAPALDNVDKRLIDTSGILDAALESFLEIRRDCEEAIIEFEKASAFLSQLETYHRIKEGPDASLCQESSEEKLTSTNPSKEDRILLRFDELAEITSLPLKADVPLVEVKSFSEHLSDLTDDDPNLHETSKTKSSIESALPNRLSQRHAMSEAIPANDAGQSEQLKFVEPQSKSAVLQLDNQLLRSRTLGLGATPIRTLDSTEIGSGLEPLVTRVSNLKNPGIEGTVGDDLRSQFELNVVAYQANTMLNELGKQSVPRSPFIAEDDPLKGYDLPEIVSKIEALISERGRPAMPSDSTNVLDDPTQFYKPTIPRTGVGKMLGVRSNSTLLDAVSDKLYQFINELALSTRIEIGSRADTPSIFSKLTSPIQALIQESHFVVADFNPVGKLLNGYNPNHFRRIPYPVRALMQSSGDQRVSIRDDSTVLEKYPDLKLLYEEMQGATRRLTELAMGLRSSNGLISQMSEGVRATHLKLSELMASADLLVEETQKLWKSVIDEKHSLELTLKQVEEADLVIDRVNQNISNAIARLATTTSTILVNTDEMLKVMPPMADQDLARLN